MCAEEVNSGNFHCGLKAFAFKMFDVCLLVHISSADTAQAHVVTSIANLRVGPLLQSTFWNS